MALWMYLGSDGQGRKVVRTVEADDRRTARLTANRGRPFGRPLGDAQIKPWIPDEERCVGWEWNYRVTERYATRTCGCTNPRKFGELCGVHEARRVEHERERDATQARQEVAAVTDGLIIRLLQATEVEAKRWGPDAVTIDQEQLDKLVSWCEQHRAPEDVRT